MTNDLNFDPYYDDFDAQKNFIKILFRPARPVQTRELTQLQSILQNQVSTFADNVFSDNTPILGAKIRVDFQYRYITVSNIVDSTGTIVSLTDLIGTDLANNVDANGNPDPTGIPAGIALVESVYDSGTEQVLYIKYRNGKFNVNDTLYVQTNTNVSMTVATESFGVSASNDAGIMYTNGAFVVVNEQFTIVDNLTNTGSYYIGFELNPDNMYINSDMDSSLLDPANGTYNYTAPGADRLKYDLVLKAYDMTDQNIPASFFSLITIENGEMTKDQSGQIEYGKILDLFARRTYDESGNYSIEDFPLRIENNPNDTTLLDLALEPGKAYVMGYEHEKDFTETIQTPKARDFFTETTADRYFEYGPWVEVGHAWDANGNKTDAISGNIDISKKPYCVLYSGAGGTGNPIPSAANKKIFNLVSLNRVQTGELVAYLSGASGAINLLGSASSIVLTDSTGTPLTGAAAGWIDIEKHKGKPIYGGVNRPSPIVELDESEVAVKRIVPSSATYEAIRSSTITSDAAGVATLNAPDVDTDFVTYSSGGLITATEGGAGIYIPATNYVVSNQVGGISNVTINGLTPNATIHITYKVRIRNIQANPLTKQLTRVPATGTTPMTADANGVIMLGQSDCVRLVTITDSNGADVSSIAVFDNGQRDYYYDEGKISDLVPNATYNVAFEYYVHNGGGGYFSADSYPTYEDIYDYTSEDGTVTYNLRNSIDFRRKLSDAQSIGVDIIDSAGAPFICDYEYYVPRIDKIILDKNGSFIVEQGIASRNPDEPDISNVDSMLLYTIAIPPYTFNPDDVIIEKSDNRRYTMRDIGNIDKRVENLEYYTSLNMLEKEAQDLKILAADGTTKFKNGIFVDNFESYDGSNKDSAEYRAVIHPEKGRLRGPFNVDHMTMYPVDDPTTAQARNIRINENTVTLDYVEEVFVKQPHASESINVNPYAVFSWIGEIELTPSSDHWVDVITLPLIQRTFGNPVRRQVFDKWGAWQTTWTGITSSTTSNWGLFWNRWTQTAVTRTTVQSRKGVRTIITPTVSKGTEHRVVSREVLPFMRARSVTFRASHMRPGIQLKAFFDGVDVSAYCNGLKTDAAGNAVGTFNLPAGKFTVGTKEFRLSDVDGENISTATSHYTASGMLERHQTTVTTVFGSRITRTPIADSKSSTATTVVRRRRRWYDPLAETFLVSTKNERGIYLSSIDLFFETADTSLPISIQIVETDNGYPSQNIVPYSKVDLVASEVNTSSDGSAATTFTFSDPVYLADGTEYAIVIMTNSTNYKAFKSTVGKVDLITGKGIAKQPYAGVFFTSQNASTWSADQMSDLKFTLKKCKFNVGTGTHKISTRKTYIGVDATLDSTTGLPKFVRGDHLVRLNGSTVEHLGYISKVDYTQNHIYLVGRSALTINTNDVVYSYRYRRSVNTWLYRGYDYASSATVTLGETDRNHVMHALFYNTKVDMVTPEGTSAVSKIGFGGAAPSIAFTPTKNHKLPALTKISRAAGEEATIDVVLSTTDPNVSPIVSLQRTNLIAIENDEILIVPVASSTGFQIGESVSSTVGATTSTGTIYNIVGNELHIISDNKIDFANGATIVGATSNATSTIAHATGSQLRNLGSYVTNSVNLSNPSDDLRLYFDANLPGSSYLDVQFKVSGDYVPQYAQIDNTPTILSVAPDWSVSGAPYFGLEKSIIGKEATIYDIGTPTTGMFATAAAQTTCIISKMEATRAYLSAVGDTSVFIGTTLTNNTFLVTSETLAAAPKEYGTGATIAAGDHVIHKGLLWVANVSAPINPPEANVLDWAQVPGIVISNMPIQTDTASPWRKMKVSNKPTKNAIGVAEYQYEPDELISEQFTQFIIKVDIYGYSNTSTPYLENLRAIAAIG